MFVHERLYFKLWSYHQHDQICMSNIFNHCINRKNYYLAFLMCYHMIFSGVTGYIICVAETRQFNFNCIFVHTLVKLVIWIVVLRVIKVLHLIPLPVSCLSFILSHCLWISLQPRSFSFIKIINIDHVTEKCM